jgi:hypothetical protein
MMQELVLKFLLHLEGRRDNSVRCRNLRLKGLWAVMEFAGRRDVSALHAIKQVVAVSMKRFDWPLLGQRTATWRNDWRSPLS